MSLDDLSEMASLLAANVAEDHDPGPAWVRVRPDAAVFVAPLGTEPLSETYATNWGRITLAEAKYMAAEDAHEKERARKLWMMEVEAESERQSQARVAELNERTELDLRCYALYDTVSLALRPDNQPTPAMTSLVNAVSGVVTGLTHVHDQDPAAFHEGLGLEAIRQHEECPVCELTLNEFVAKSVIGQLENVAYDVNECQPGRSLERRQILEAMVAIRRAELTDSCRVDDKPDAWLVITRAQQVVTAGMEANVSLADVGRVRLALEKERNR